MQIYRNVNGTSGVIAFETTETSVTVMFRDGWKYLYTYASAGVQAIEAMKVLARQGQGLNSFINRSVKKSYERKFA